jgi:NADH dehydrogenase FAD-containing subunit
VSNCLLPLYYFSFHRLRKIKVQMSSTQERREVKCHVVRVAVVGGGVAGATLANRLAELSASISPVAGSATFEVDLFDQVTSMTYQSFCVTSFYSIFCI